MKIPEEFIGCRVKSNREENANYGETIGRIVSWYSCKSDVYLLLITNKETFKRIDVDYVKIVKEDMIQIKNGLIPEKTDRWEILDL